MKTTHRIQWSQWSAPSEELETSLVLCLVDDDDDDDNDDDDGDAAESALLVWWVGTV